MPKINQEEYEVLKGLDDKWKWIARDEAQQTYAYEYRPIKSKIRGQWESNWNDYYLLPHDWLQFIQWENEEPYNIAELIEEFEFEQELLARRESILKGEPTVTFNLEDYESEETEMNKQKLIEKWESAIGAAEFYGRGKEDRLIEYMRNFVDDLNQLDEPEVLSQKWIDEHKETIFNLDEDFETEFIKVEDLQNPLVPKQERLTIPNYVAEWISEHHEKFDLYPALRRLENGSTRDYPIYKWYRENTLNFVIAYLTGEYGIEEEQKYVVELPNPNNQMGRHKNVFLNKKDGKVFIDSASLFVNDITKYGQFALTEEEIKKDFEWAWKFAKPVEEMEE